MDLRMRLLDAAVNLLRAGQVPEATDRCRRSLVLDPGLPDGAEILGALRHRASDFAEAARWSLRAHRLRPERAEPLVNLGVSLRDARGFVAAETCFRAALDRNPAFIPAHLGLAVGRLIQGDLAAGFAALEHRWKRLETPQWSGDPLHGRRLLVHAEQGFGDAIQFARFLPHIEGTVVFEVHPAQVRLFRRIAPWVTVVGRTDPPPPHDVQCPILSLPRALGTTLDRVAPQGAYLQPEPAEADAWRQRLASLAGARVGLVWAGNPRHDNDRNRSIPSGRLAPLIDAVPEVSFVSLQTGDTRGALPRLVDPMDDVRDFADTAAIVANLDLVIAVDTAVLHLAAALGRPTWGLLPHVPDWRWLLDRSDSPWYPSLTLFRQPRPGDWDSVLSLVAARLRALAKRKFPAS